MNALKTGLHAKSLLLPSEKLADLELLIDEYYQCHHPATPEARCLLDDLIRCEWTLRRLDAAEAANVALPAQQRLPRTRAVPPRKFRHHHAAAFSKLQYRIDATRRARDRALKALQQLEAEAAPAARPASSPDPPSLTPSPQITSPQIGFVLPTPCATPPDPGTDRRPRPRWPDSAPSQLCYTFGL